MNVYNFQSTDCASSHPKSKGTYINPESSTSNNRTDIQGIYGENSKITENGDEDVLRPITSKRKHPLIEEISVSQSTSKERNYTDTSNHKKSKHQESWNLRVQINIYTHNVLYILPADDSIILEHLDNIEKFWFKWFKNYSMAILEIFLIRGLLLC